VTGRPQRQRRWGASSLRRGPTRNGPLLEPTDPRAAPRLEAGPAGPLATPRPAVTPERARTCPERCYGLATPIALTELPAERDRNFLVVPGEGAPTVLKVSNPADGPEVLDLQAAALRHIEEHDPRLPVMRLIPTAHGTDRCEVTGTDGRRYLARMLTHMPGRKRTAAELDDRDLHAYGAVVGRTVRALRGFFHPAARYAILWDLRATPELRPLLAEVTDAQRRRLATRVLDRFDERVHPVLTGLPAQPIHNDLTLDNVLFGPDRRVSGILDLGDLTHTARVCDLAIALASVLGGRPDPLDAVSPVVAGFVTATPLEDEEVEVVADLVAARLAAWGLIAAWRARNHPGDLATITAGEDEAWAHLHAIGQLGERTVTARLREAAVAGPRPYASVRGPGASALLTRRRRVLGHETLSYHRPLHLVHAEGVRVWDADGRSYLDAYNNVPVVGHGHPRVADAIAAQSRRINTNTRYLHGAAVELAERLVATLPGALDTVLFVNSGSEANDLAWRLACAANRAGGALVTSNAYHGVTTATDALSPEVWPRGHSPAHVATFAPQDDPATAIAGAAERLGDLPVTALFLDPALTSDGILAPDHARLRQVATAARRTGALFVADEVQSGHGRSGEHLWQSVAARIEPDIVTMGKPMGNGHPVAAIVTRAAIAEALTGRSEVFSTFGGNPVSCVAALAVLDVIAEEELIRRAAEVGSFLRSGLAELSRNTGSVREVRGRGLLIGIELRGEVDNPDPGREVEPSRVRARTAGEVATAVVNGMRDRGVLIGATGPRGDVLKVRPPLVFGRADAEDLLAVLEEVLRRR
jgi:4-aminobutyrate aminotransferase-like enzyme/Ser/Thr protein kinase RdoA (MazF antagonist)